MFPWRRLQHRWKAKLASAALAALALLVLLTSHCRWPACDDWGSRKERMGVLGNMTAQEELTQLREIFLHNVFQKKKILLYNWGEFQAW